MNNRQTAGWRTRQHAVVNNCGRITDVLMWKSIDSDAFHIRRTTKDVGQQRTTTYESILPFEDSLRLYQEMSQVAVVELVNPPDPAKVGYTIVEEDNGDVVVSERE